MTTGGVAPSEFTGVERRNRSLFEPLLGSRAAEGAASLAQRSRAAFAAHVNAGLLAPKPCAYLAAMSNRAPSVDLTGAAKTKSATVNILPNFQEL